MVVNCAEEDQGEIVALSQETLAITGFEKEELLRSKLSELLPSCLTEWHNAAMRRYITDYKLESSSAQQQKVLLTKKKHLLSFDFSATLLPDIKAGIHVAAVITPLPAMGSRLLIFYELFNHKIHGFSKLIEQYLPFSWEMKRALDGVKYNELVKTLELPA